MELVRRVGRLPFPPTKHVAPRPSRMECFSLEDGVMYICREVSLSLGVSTRCASPRLFVQNELLVLARPVPILVGLLFRSPTSLLLSPLPSPSAGCL